MACGHLYKLESYMRRRTDTLVPLWAKSGLRSNLSASNLQNFPGGAYPQTPVACACISTHMNHSIPQSQMSSIAVAIACSLGFMLQLQHSCRDLCYSCSTVPGIYINRPSPRVWLKDEVCLLTAINPALATCSVTITYPT